MKIIYEFFRVLGVLTGYPFNWVFFKRKVYYENKEKSNRFIKGGAVIISNHYSPLDYVSHVFVVFPRKLNVVVAESAFEIPFFNFGLKFWGGIKADRLSRSLKFVDESASLTKKGQLVQIFPEAHNTPDGTIKSFYPSYILIALKSGVPIVPIITDGNYGFFKRNHVMIGEPISISDYLDVDNYTRTDIYRANREIRQKVLNLKSELDSRTGKNKKEGNE